MSFTCRINVPNSVNAVQNQGHALTDTDNDGDFSDETSPGANSDSNQSIWVRGQTPPTAIAIVDPVITKSVDPQFAIPGENVTWTITVFNPGSTPTSNIVVTDSLPNEVEILSVFASAGNIVFSGQNVTFTQASLGAGQSTNITINTRVRSDINVRDIVNTAILSVNGRQFSASASLHIIKSALPSTGEHPEPPLGKGLPLLFAGLALIGLFIQRIISNWSKDHTV
jgi:uncharacterized repeat protein (TIGR01451 family)